MYGAIVCNRDRVCGVNIRSHSEELLTVRQISFRCFQKRELFFTIKIRNAPIGSLRWNPAWSRRWMILHWQKFVVVVGVQRETTTTLLVYSFNVDYSPKIDSVSFLCEIQVKDNDEREAVLKNGSWFLDKRGSESVAIPDACLPIRATRSTPEYSV